MKQKSRKNRTNPGQRSTAAADAGGLRSKDTRRQIFLALSLALITLAIYSPVRTHAFVNYDEDDYITRNSHIRSGLSWQSVEWALTATAQANWHPVTWISHAADCQLFE